MNAIDTISLYDFETAIEAAVQAVFVANDLEAYTSFSSPEMDRPRPRVEIEFQTGPATGHRSTFDDVYRPDCFTGNCSITVITNTGDAENSGEVPSNSAARAHAQYRALVRFHSATIETTLTNDAAGDDTMLPYHSLNRFVESGTSPTIHHESGVLASQINFDVHFNIRSSAWPIETPPATP
jgi:hypothetical protein